MSSSSRHHHPANQDSIVDRLVALAQSNETVISRRDAVIVVEPGASPREFQDHRSAALFLLLQMQTPIAEFVKYASQQRDHLLQAPTQVRESDTWKYLLLQDPSLEKEDPLTTASDASSYTDQDFCWALSPLDPTDNLTCQSKHTEAPKAKRPRTQQFQTTSSVSTNENEGQRNCAVRVRGSTRRLPELEGLIVCPDCGRKGQSIFDPNNSTADGVVWQYFYCRNGECPRGRSSSRYIGWTTRTKGSNMASLSGQ
eukprot:Protomagalhaensia_wolfi_Nauph_80__3056@NODE_312_length_2811_cov_54_823232_g235_i0_p2_GENE_NODE_312_length_2811_cov_54_823232_g235_i0NODE_312_length_2811_cov_54_823232_g235_i0_p2_ORF_typecomplete_len255_score24_49Zn_ribbon_recom/PF13408_6/6_8e03Zn_ribbon_recom/PF13408_6/0_02zf_CopZ/PF18423_1/38_NODE_312_length_2811_cov_54_823232_g235_i017522516